MTIPESLDGADIALMRDGKLLTINVQKGCVTLGTILCQSDSNEHYIHAINVFRKKNQGKGIGTYLLIVAMNKLLSETKKPIGLLCKHTVACFYERVGFRSISRKKSKIIDMYYNPLTTQSPEECLTEYYKNKQLMTV